MQLLLPAFLTSLLTAFTMFIMKDHINSLLMNLFRDLSRFKARKRLYGNEAALLPLLLGRENPIKSRIDEIENGVTMTIAELAEFDGRTSEVPIYIAINKHIFDVSSARSKYGPGTKYHTLAGRDATVAFATACFKPHCLVKTIEKLSAEQQRQVDRWEELYAQHDKYTYVGRLVRGDAVEDSVAKALSEQHQEDEEEEVLLEYPPADVAQKKEAEKVNSQAEDKSIEKSVPESLLDTSELEAVVAE
jgi:membrane-associated progesterone receptor component